MSVPPADVDAGLAGKDPGRIAGMFDAIAHRYDFLNTLLSAGLDGRWRTRMLGALDLSRAGVLLDLCTGTGDVAISAVGRCPGVRLVIGIDFAFEMLRVARHKLRRDDLAVSLVRGDAVHLPVSSESVDAVTIAFGIRNVVDRRAACGEVLRVLRPGGSFGVLEFGVPRIPGVRALYLFYFRRVLPRLGAIVARHAQAYSYLPASVGTFPSPSDFTGELRAAGFERVEASRLSLGIVYLYVARKPNVDAAVL